MTNARGVFAPAIGQYVLAAILRINERADERQALQLAHRWPDRAGWASVSGRLLRGQTVLVVGYGGLGREVARLASALGMRVIAAKRDPRVLVDDGYRAPGTGDPGGSIPERVVSESELGSVVSLADVVVLTLPLTDRTRGLFDERLIAQMRPDAWLINVGRGVLADESALATGADRAKNRRRRPGRVRHRAATGRQPVLGRTEHHRDAAPVGRGHPRGVEPCRTLRRRT